MAFRRKKKSTSAYDSPEALFRDRRNRTVQGLLAHQSDILRDYAKEAVAEPNVALELPTGSGKTLVGLLIAEWCRQSNEERVLYLCPTKQLVQQVCEQAERKYGIHATPFIGSKKGYDSDDKRKYLLAETVAVAPYSALFNIKPFFENPQVIVLDDAHASENYIASAWSLQVNRCEHRDIYLGLLQLLEDDLPETQRDRFRSENQDDQAAIWIEKIPTPRAVAQRANIVSFLDSVTPNEKLKYPWVFLREHLDACHIYVSYGQVLIRPYIPPSQTHAPFAGARQRVFMSATLGLGGDLERISGLCSLHRLPIPEGWDKQGIGRRYFIFPELSLPSDEMPPLIKEMVDFTGRALVLVPSDRRVQQYSDSLKHVPVVKAKDMEETKDHFVEQDMAVAVLANRYDGMDFPDEECRLLIVDGLPKAGNLQERYLESRMVAGVLFRDRIRTRLVQAFGRCTRSATDYAAIAVIGEDFFEWLVHKEKRSLFHPELQGELIFGAEEAKERTAQDFVENLRIFIEHGEEWDEVDADILEYRDAASQAAIPGEAKLLESAKHEVDYLYKMWHGDYEAACDLAQQVAGILSGDELKGMRGFWNYLAGAAAALHVEKTSRAEWSNKARELYKRASACLPAVQWLRDLSAVSDSPEPEAGDKWAAFLDANVERIEALFDTRSYALPIKFEKDMQKLLEGIKSEDADEFEAAHVEFGRLLGFDADNSNSDAAPDPWWISNERLCLVSEDKSDSTPANAIPVKHARQAESHEKWIRDQISIPPEGIILTVMITPQTKIHHLASIYAKNVYWWHIDDFRECALQAVNVLRTVRASFSGPGSPAWRDSVRSKLLANRLDPSSIIERATSKRLPDLPVEKKVSEQNDSSNGVEVAT